MKPTCPFDHDGPIRALYGVELLQIADLPQTCPSCGATLEYAGDVVFITLPEPPTELRDPQGNVVMTSEPVKIG